MEIGSINKLMHGESAKIQKTEQDIYDIDIEIAQSPSKLEHSQVTIRTGCQCKTAAQSCASHCGCPPLA